MSTNALEKVFWQMGSAPAEFESYRASPEVYLEKFRLTEDERRLVLDLDVAQLLKVGVNPLLLMMSYAMIQGGLEAIGEYMGKLMRAQASA